jgi:hypothetical protein
MAGSCRVLLCVSIVLLLGGNPASAFGYWYTPAYVYSSYYYAPIPVYYQYYWAVPAYSCQPASAVTAIPADSPSTSKADAEPPVLPAATGEPPVGGMNQRPPTISATRAQSGNVVPGGAPLPKDRCRVGFWNLTGREVTLTVEGKSVTLAKNRSVTMDLERNFAWQVDQRPQHVERIAEGQFAYDLVIRE